MEVKMPELNFKIYRAVNPKLENTSILKKYHNTMRPPANVPYLVDNLWELTRPKNYPNRRHSVFASPTPELALEAAGGGTVYTVEFKGKYKLCQVKNSKDSRYHPDCKSLKKFLPRLYKNRFEQDWINSKLSEKEDFGKLWIPCLTRDELNFLFGSNEKLRKIKKDICNAVTYWNDVVLIKNGNGLPDPEGELFFEAFDGYYLES
jgi:hypothetical protein